MPDDISVVGFDDMPPYTYTNKPALTTITSDRQEMGRIAIQRLHQIINNPSLVPINIVMPSTLVIRDSSSPPQ